MKRILILVGLVFCVMLVKAQFPTTDSLRNYNSRYTLNSAIVWFTNFRGQTLLRGMIDWIDSARLGTTGSVGMDTAFALNDSVLRYKKNGVWTNVIIRGAATQGNLIGKSGNAFNFGTGTWSSDVNINGAGSGGLDLGRVWYMDSLYGFKVNTGIMQLFMQPEADHSFWVGPKTDAGSYDSSFYVGLQYGTWSHRKLTLTGLDSLLLTGDISTSSSDTTDFKPVGINAQGRIKKIDYWPGSGGGGGLSGLTSNRGLYATSATTAATDAGFSYDPTTNKATFDSVEGVRLASQSLRIAYNNSLSRKLNIYHGNADVSTGIYSNETLANSEWNPVVSMGINFDGSRASWGHARMGVEGRYRPYPGAPFTWYEYHWEHALLSGAIIRPLSWEGRTDSSSGSFSLRANSYNFFDLDGLTGTNRDSVFATLNNNGLLLKFAEGTDGFLMRHKNGIDFMRLWIDATNGTANLTHSLPLSFNGTVNIGGELLTPGLTGGIGGTPVEHRGLTLTASSDVQLKMAPANAVDYGIGFRANTNYWHIGGNSGNLYGRFGSTEAAGILGDHRGITAPIRFEVSTTAGVYTYTSVGADGNWLFGGSVQSPTARVEISPGSTSRAPLKFQSGPLLSTAQAGAVEFLTDAYYATITTGDARKTFAFLESPIFTGNVTTPTIKITGGSPGAGKVLTSDADGDATWETAAGGAAWGSITGTLSSQTDLNTALGLKAPLASPTFTGTVTTPLIKITSGSPGLGKFLMSDADGDASWTALEEVVTAEVNTSSTSATTLATITPTTGEWGVLDVTLSSVVTTSGDDGTLGRAVVFYKVLGNGTLSIQSTTNLATTYSSNSSTWTVDVSGSDIRVRVTSGVATPTVWNCTITKRNSFSAL